MSDMDERQLEDAMMAAYMKENFGIRPELRDQSALPALTEEDRMVDAYVEAHFAPAPAPAPAPEE